MTLVTKAVIEALLLCGAFGLGWWSHKAPTCPGGSSTSDTTTITDTVVKPDGTTTTHTVVHDVDQVKNPPLAAPLPQWSLGLTWQPTLVQERRWAPVGAELSRRILGNLWLSLGYMWTADRSILIGMRYEW